LIIFAEKIKFKIMKRNDFLKLLGASGIAVAVAPLAPASTPKKEESPIKSESPRIAIDVNSIHNFVVGSRKITPAEILDLYHQTGILIYKSGVGIHPPIVLSGELKIVKP
jgi:hypothetical protein